jgi:cytochrome P450
MAHPDDDLGAFEPFDPAFIACPFPTYDALRAGPGATWVPHGKGFWFVTRHDLVRQVAGDPTRFSSQSGSLGTVPPSPELLARIAEVARDGVGDVPTLLTLDPPGHTRNRRLISRAFSPAAVKRFEPLARAIARELIAGWRDGEEIDVVARFAVPLPVRVIARGLDVPDDRVDDFKRWSDASVAAIGTRLDDDAVVASVVAMTELKAFILEQIERKRAEPLADDVLSNLVHAQLSDDETSDLSAGGAGEVRRTLSDLEIVSIVRQLIVAGNETTTNLLGQLLVRFAAEPSWWARLRDDPSLVPAVVEEGLRMASPSAVNQRRTTCPVHLDGADVPAGSNVLVSYLAANHDPRVFPDPERFDPTRPNLGEHLAFGRGIHFCPGAALARMEARVALEELTAAVESYTVPPIEALEWNESFQLRALRRIPFTPRLRRG